MIFTILRNSIKTFLGYLQKNILLFKYTVVKYNNLLLVKGNVIFTENPHFKSSVPYFTKNRVGLVLVLRATSDQLLSRSLSVAGLLLENW